MVGTANEGVPAILLFVIPIHSPIPEINFREMAKKPHRKGGSQGSKDPGGRASAGGAFVDRSGKAHTFGPRKQAQPSGPSPLESKISARFGSRGQSGEQSARKAESTSARPPTHKITPRVTPVAPNPAYSNKRDRVEKPDSENLRFKKKTKFKDRDRFDSPRRGDGKSSFKSGKPPKSGYPQKFDRRDREERGGHRAQGDRYERRPKGNIEAGVHKATVDKNRKGFGFLIFEKRGMEDAFIPPREAEKLFHGDRVEVTLSSRGEVENLRVLEHRFREVVGRYTAHPNPQNPGGWVIYERKRAREEIYIPEQGTHKIKSDDWIRVKLEFHETGPHAVTGEIKEVYGPELPPSADVGMIAAEFNLIEEHSQASEAEAQSHHLEVPGRDLDGREDLREVPFITIDGETARDFDDAVFVERSKSGFILWVAIADVSHYVSEGTALDKDARSRGTSVYFPERAFHMLPRALSEGLCSLRPDLPRLAMVAKMHFDRAGKIHDTELMEAVIQSKRRATYNEIQAEWEQNKKNKEWEYLPHFELFHALKKVRQERGSIDFDLPESELIVKPTGEVVSIKERARLDAHRLIEEFMIAANEAVTEWMLARQWPFVYRVHEEPATQSLDRFQKLAATVGVKFSLEDSESPKVMADLVRTLEGHPAQALLNMALLRSLKQAVYSSTHGIHYGLASNAYTHFTSPIRRYPDLVVHRLLRQALRTEKGKLKPMTASERAKLESDLVDVCEHCSYRERLASDAERESIRLKQVRAMIPHVGEEFDAKVMGMIETGLFAQLKDPYCEGMINRESMMDDFYIFNEERMIFYGRRKKRTFKVGDPVRINVLKADIDRRQIDFGLLDGAEAREPRESKKPKKGPWPARKN
jgi:ribonuclease R